MNKFEVIFAEDPKKVSTHCYLQSMKVERDFFLDEVSRYRIGAVFCSVPSDGIGLFFEFFDAVNFSLKSIDGVFAYVLNINDVSYRQQEGMNYCVSESEYGAFSFYCKDYDVKFIELDV